MDNSVIRCRFHWQKHESDYYFLVFSQRYCHTNWKTTDKRSLTCLKCILKISCFPTIYNSLVTNMKFIILSKGIALFNACYCFFLFLNKLLMTLKLRRCKCNIFQVYYLCSSNHLFIMLSAWLYLEE